LSKALPRIYNDYYMVYTSLTIKRRVVWSITLGVEWPT